MPAAICIDAEGERSRSSLAGCTPKVPYSQPAALSLSRPLALPLRVRNTFVDFPWAGSPCCQERLVRSCPASPRSSGKQRWGHSADLKERLSSTECAVSVEEGSTAGGDDPCNGELSPEACEGELSPGDDDNVFYPEADYAASQCLSVPCTPDCQMPMTPDGFDFHWKIMVDQPEVPESSGILVREAHKAKQAESAAAFGHVGLSRLLGCTMPGSTPEATGMPPLPVAAPAGPSTPQTDGRKTRRSSPLSGDARLQWSAACPQPPLREGCPAMTALEGAAAAMPQDVQLKPPRAIQHRPRAEDVAVPGRISRAHASGAPSASSGPAGGGPVTCSPGTSGPASSKGAQAAVPLEPGMVLRQARPAASPKRQNGATTATQSIGTTTATTRPRMTLRLNAIIGSKDLPQDLPSIGSALHGSGRCKPCAFVHTNGCVNGLECRHCHLCEADEKKKRHKMKIESQRKARKLKQALARLASSPPFIPAP